MIFMGTATQKMIQTAKDAGVPREQLERFLKAEYVPFPWQMRFHALSRTADNQDGPVKIGCGGARGPGKSHAIFAQITLDDCQRVRGLKGLFLRQTGRAAQESFGDLIFRILSEKVNYQYSEHKGLLKFNNNSRVILGGFKDERDIDSYIGIEYDFIAIEEVNQLTKKKIDMLLGSMRTSKKNWRPRLYVSFNPSGIGHQNIKETYVLPYRQNNETETRFIPSTYKDNPKLNREYIQYLEGLTGNLGRAWREGDFDVFEGMFFNEWSYAKHTCEPFQIPSSWKRYRTIDYGRTNPFAAYWVAIDHDGTAWVYKEYYIAGKDADINAQKVVLLSQKYKEGLPLFRNGEPIQENYEYSMADNSIFSKTGHGETIAQIFQKNGLMCLPCHKDRVARWNIMHQYLRIDPKTNEPKIKFFRNCYHAIRTIPLCIHNENKPEDLYGDFADDELGAQGVDHAADSVAYLLHTFRDRKTPKPLDLTQRRLKEWQRHLGESGEYNPNFYKDEV